jgi:predicted ferric reductase
MKRGVVLGGVATTAAVPLAVALGDAHLSDAPALMVLSTATAAMSVGAMAVQPWLTALRPRRTRVREHAVLGLVIVGLVLVHIGALLASEPADALFAMSWDGPTRARMALLASLLLLATAGLGVLRRRLRIDTMTWRILHAVVAALGIALGVGHAVLTDGALDEEGTVVLLTLGIIGVGGAVTRVVRTVHRSPQAPAVLAGTAPRAPKRQ